MIAIGVTGHRFLAELEKVTAGVDRALDRIEEAFGQGPLAVVSALAEGADRLVARRVLTRPGAKLIVALPVPESDYVTDFASSASREAFRHLLSRAARVITLPPTPTRDEAYTAAGGYVLDHCDVLLAVWDGREAQGKGGTAQIVVEARRRGLPLAWVHAGNRRPGTHQPISLGKEQGTVTFERLPTADAPRGRYNGP